jgi:hypothetical protein
MIKFKEKNNFQFLIFSGWGGVGVGVGGVKLVSCTVFHSKKHNYPKFSMPTSFAMYNDVLIQTTKPQKTSL